MSFSSQGVVCLSAFWDTPVAPGADTTPREQTPYPPRADTPTHLPREQTPQQTATVRLSAFGPTPSSLSDKFKLVHYVAWTVGKQAFN